ncbi:MAG: hypothetical protein LKF36_10960 [Lactobacillus sp.]|nr:hypothetical protein [Lactobacillus sp.]
MADSTLAKSIAQMNQLLDGNDPGVTIHVQQLPLPSDGTGDQSNTSPSDLKD